MSEQSNYSLETTSDTVIEALAAQEELAKEMETLETLTLPFGVGEELRRARETKNLSISHVAQSLRLGNHQIEALEKEEWDKLPGRVFVIGFVRNYAKFLEIESDSLIERLNATLFDEKPNLYIKRGDAVLPPKTSDNRAVLIALLILALAVLGYFFLPANTLRSFENLLPETQTHFKSEKNSALTVEEPPILPTSSVSVEETPNLIPPNVITESAEKTTND